MKKSFFFVRHGQTDYNASKTIQGQCDRSDLAGVRDLGLNATGQEQAHRLAGLLKAKGETFDLVLSSDLRRAMETGEILAQALGLRVTPCPALREMFFGPAWEGRPVQLFKETSFDPPILFDDPVSGGKLEARDGRTIRLWHKDTDPRYVNVAHPGGESKAEVAARAMQGLHLFTQTHPTCEKILIPTHNGLLRFIMPELGAVEHLEGLRTLYDTDKRTLTLVERIKA